jgi:glycosyltransferase involved in cell wall biosynthesis
VRKKLMEASVFVLPCVAETGGGMDNLPTVILEAMEASLPVVSTHVAAVPEMVQDGITGLLVEEHQPHQLAGALRELLLNQDQRQRMGAAGRQFAEQHFAVAVTVSQLHQHLNQVL